MNKYKLIGPHGIELDDFEAASLLNEIKLNEEEETKLNIWINTGNSFYTNPWFLAREDGAPYNFIEAYRIIKGQCDECL